MTAIVQAQDPSAVIDSSRSDDQPLNDGESEEPSDAPEEMIQERPADWENVAPLVLPSSDPSNTAPKLIEMKLGRIFFRMLASTWPICVCLRQAESLTRMPCESYLENRAR